MHDIERLTLALVVAAAVAPRSAAIGGNLSVIQSARAYNANASSKTLARGDVAVAMQKLGFLANPSFTLRSPSAARQPRKSASDDRFTAGARLRWYLSRCSALPARAHIASDGVTVPARWPYHCRASSRRRAAKPFR